MELFNAEKDLVEAFKSRSEEFLNTHLKRSTKRSFIIPEFNSYFGIADLVFGTLKSSFSVSKMRSSINPNWILPLATLKRGNTVTLQAFCHDHKLSKTTGRKCLNDYTRAGFLEKIAFSTFKVTRQYQPPTDIVVSVEAKLRDWKRAIEQAKRYQRFSDFSFVLLDKAGSKQAVKNMNLFREQNIGLLTLDDSNLEVHFFPFKNQKKAVEYYLRVSEMAYDYFTTAQTV
jgi:hypothetical protein